MEAIDRFTNKYEEDSCGCWLWTAALQTIGYCQFDHQLAHRWSYEHFVGPIPKGLQLNHKCEVKQCVNPDHLEAVTAKYNMNYSDQPTWNEKRNRTHCLQGHKYTQRNTRFRRESGGSLVRICRRCEAATSKRYRD